MTAVRRCSGVTTFSQQVLHDLEIQCLISDETLELPVLFFECAQALRLAHLEPAVLALPAIEGLIGHAVPAHELRDLGAGVPLVEDRYDLFFRESALLHQSSRAED